ncbi:MAG: hypothetical protein R3E08_02930 [Thiotrichaceae bacterium]
MNGKVTVPVSDKSGKQPAQVPAVDLKIQLQHGQLTEPPLYSG